MRLWVCVFSGGEIYLTFRWDFWVFNPMPIFAVCENLLPAAFDDIGAAVLCRIRKRCCGADFHPEIRCWRGGNYTLCFSIFFLYFLFSHLNFSAFFFSHCEYRFCRFRDFFFAAIFRSHFNCTLFFLALSNVSALSSRMGIFRVFSDNQHFYITLELTPFFPS